MSYSLLGERPDFSGYVDSLPTLQGLPTGSGTPTAPPAIGYGSGGGMAPGALPGPYSSPAPMAGLQGIPEVGASVPQAAMGPNPELLRRLREIQELSMERARAKWSASPSGPAIASNQALQALEMEDELTNPNSKRSLYARQVAAQEEQSKLAWAKGAADLIGQFSGLDTESKKMLEPVYAGMFSRLFKQKGVEVPPALFRAMAEQPGTAEAAFSVLSEDKMFTPDERKTYMAALRKMKPEQVPDFIKKVQEDKVRDVIAQVSPNLAGIVRQLKKDRGLDEGKPLDPEVLLEHAANHPLFAGSQIFRRALLQVMSGKEGEDILTNVGVLSPSARRKIMEDQAKAAAEAEGKKKEASKEILKSVSTEIAADPMFGQRGYSSVDDIPPEERPAWIQRAIARKAQREQGLRAEQAELNAQATKRATLEAENDRTYGESPTRAQGTTYRDRQTGEEAPANARMGDLRNNDRYKPLTHKQEENFQSVQETKGHVVRWFDAVQKLTDVPGANFKQALEGYAKTAMGIPNVKVELDALKGTILRVAGAMQGARSQLSDQDRKSVETMFAGIFDTRQSAAQRLGVLKDVLGVMEGVSLGRLTPPQLSEQLNEAAKRATQGTKIKGYTRIN